MKIADHDLSRLPQWPAAFNHVPKWAFHADEVYELEIERIFKGPVWHPIGHACEMPNPGDYKTVTLGHTPLLMQRDAQGRINVYHNVCPHRGTKLTAPFRGSQQEIECPYHRWVFDIGGNLRSCPAEEDFPPEFKKQDYNLRKVRTAEHYGLVFATLNDATPSLADYLSGLEEPLRWGLGGDGRLKLLGYQKVVYESNWKIYMDNDGYHAPLLHAAFRLLKWQGGAGQQVRTPLGHWLVESENPGQVSKSDFLRDPTVIQYLGGDTPRNKGHHQGSGSLLVLLWPLIGLANHLDIINLRFANPVGVDKVEVHYAYFCHEDDDEQMVRHRIRQSSNMIGPSGFVSLEDATVFRRIQDALDTEPGEAYFVKGWREGMDAHTGKQNDEAPNTIWWEVYRERMGFERARR